MQSVEDHERRKNNPHPKWEVPIEVIEWQPSYTQQVCSTICIKCVSLLFFASRKLRWECPILFPTSPSHKCREPLG